jgi:hypothetical protein
MSLLLERVSVIGLDLQRPVCGTVLKHSIQRCPLPL